MPKKTAIISNSFMWFCASKCDQRPPVLLSLQTAPHAIRLASVFITIFGSGMDMGLCELEMFRFHQSISLRDSLDRCISASQFFVFLKAFVLSLSKFLPVSSSRTVVLDCV